MNVVVGSLWTIQNNEMAYLIFILYSSVQRKYVTVYTLIYLYILCLCSSFRTRNLRVRQLDAWKTSKIIPVPFIPKTNMEPNNEGLEDDFPFQRGDFQVPNVSFRGCIPKEQRATTGWIPLWWDRRMVSGWCRWTKSRKPWEVRGTKRCRCFRVVGGCGLCDSVLMLICWLVVCWLVD